MRKGRPGWINPASKKTPAVKVNADRSRAFRFLEGLTSELECMTETTEALVQRWMIAFRETPVLIDPELMRMVLDGPTPKATEEREP